MLLERRVGQTAGLKSADVYRVGNYRHLVRADATLGDVAAQSIADSEDVLGVTQRMGFQPARQAVAQAAFGGRAVVNRCILPEGAHFVDHRDAQPLADAQRGYRIEHWRMGMDDLWFDFDRQRQYSLFQLAHQGQFAQAGQPR